MSLFKRVFLRIARKRAFGIAMLAIFTLLFAFLQIGIALENTAEKEAECVRKTLGSSYFTKVYADYGDPSLRTEGENAAENMVPSYKTPVRLTDELADIIASAEGITEYNAENVDFLHTHLEFKDGFAATWMQDKLYEHMDFYDESDILFMERDRNTVALYNNTCSELHKFFGNGAYESS